MPLKFTLLTCEGLSWLIIHKKGFSNITRKGCTIVHRKCSDNIHIFNDENIRTVCYQVFSYKKEVKCYFWILIYEIFANRNKNPLRIKSKIPFALSF